MAIWESVVSVDVLSIGLTWRVVFVLLVATVGMWSIRLCVQYAHGGRS